MSSASSIEDTARGPPRPPDGAERDKVEVGGPLTARASFHFVARRMGAADRAMPSTLDDPPGAAPARGPSPTKRPRYTRYGHAKLSVNAPSRHEPTPPPAYRVRRPLPLAPMSTAIPDPITTPVFTTPRLKALAKSDAHIVVRDCGTDEDLDCEPCQPFRKKAKMRAVRRRISLGGETSQRARTRESNQLAGGNPAAISDSIPRTIPAPESQGEAGNSFMLSPGIFTQQPPLTVIACSHEDYPICAQSPPIANESPPLIADMQPLSVEGPEVRPVDLSSRHLLSEVVDGYSFAPENELLAIALTGIATEQRADDQKSPRFRDVLAKKRSWNALKADKEHLGSDSPLLFDTHHMYRSPEGSASMQGLYSNQPALTLETVAPSCHDAVRSKPSSNASFPCNDDCVEARASTRNEWPSIPLRVRPAVMTPGDRSRDRSEKIDFVRRTSTGNGEAYNRPEVREGDPLDGTGCPQVVGGNESAPNRSAGKLGGFSEVPTQSAGKPSCGNTSNVEAHNFRQLPFRENRVDTNDQISPQPTNRDCSTNGNRGVPESRERISLTPKGKSHIAVRRSQLPMSCIANLNVPCIPPSLQSQLQIRVDVPPQFVPSTRDKSLPDGIEKEVVVQTQQPRHETHKGTVQTEIHDGNRTLKLCQSEQNWSDSVGSNHGTLAVEDDSNCIASAQRVQGGSSNVLSTPVRSGLRFANLFNSRGSSFARVGENPALGAARSVGVSLLYSRSLHADRSGSKSRCESSESTDPPPDDDDREMDLWRRRMAQRPPQDYTDSEDSSSKCDTSIVVRAGYVATGLGDALSDEEGSSPGADGRADRMPRLTPGMALVGSVCRVPVAPKTGIAMNIGKEDVVDACSNERYDSRAVKRRVFEADESNERCRGEEDEEDHSGENGDCPVFLTALADLPVRRDPVVSRCQ
jgi:hypothetical protein